MIKTITFLFFFLLFLQGNATKIEGFEPNYAGKTIKFYTYNDPISKISNQLFKITIQSDGSFSEEVNIDKTYFCFAEFGIYYGMFIIEPNQTLQLKLPALRDKTFSEEKNPYFKPLRLWLQIINNSQNELNKQIINLEQEFNFLTDKYFTQLYFKQLSNYLDSVKILILNKFPKPHTPFFADQLDYKLRILESEVKLSKQNLIFKKSDFYTRLENVPAFIDLVDRVFSGKLDFEANSIKGRDLKNAVFEANTKFVRDHFQEKYELAPSMANFLLLKFLHDGFYSGKFPQNSILKMLDSPIVKNNPEKRIGIIAANIKTKLKHLMPGTMAPVICLKDLQQNQQCSNTSDKPTYIIFSDAEMQVCREHLKYISAITEKFGDKLTIFVIEKNQPTKYSQDFFAEYNIPATIVFEDSEKQTVKTFNIKSYPTCFLLDKNHTILQAPAKAPLDGFEQYFSGYLKNEHINNLRNQP